MLAEGAGQEERVVRAAAEGGTGGGAGAGVEEGISGVEGAEVCVGGELLPGVALSSQPVRPEYRMV